MTGSGRNLVEKINSYNHLYFILVIVNETDLLNRFNAPAGLLRCVLQVPDTNVPEQSPTLTVQPL